MAKAVLMGTRVYAGAIPLGANTNRIELPVEREPKEVTTFGSYDATTDSIWKEYIAGHGSGKVSVSGFWEAGAGLLDSDQFDNLGATGAWSIIPGRTADAGDLAYLLNGTRGTYSLLGANMGDIAPYSADVTASGVVARGAVLNPPGTARTASGNGTAVQVGAVTASQRLYAAVHIISAAGTSPSITFKVQSDDNSGFTTPTDRITFTAATAAGSQFSSVAGAVTDTYWRVNYTVSGTGPSFLALVTAGIG